MSDFKLHNEDGSMNLPTLEQLQKKIRSVGQLHHTPVSVQRHQMIRFMAGDASADRRAYLYDDLEEMESQLEGEVNQ